MTAMTDAVAVGAELAASRWGIDSPISELGSTQDCVLRLDGTGDARAIMKLSLSERIDAGALDAEAAALHLLDDAVPWLAVPLLRPGADGNVLQSRGRWTARVMSCVDGAALQRAPQWPPSALRSLGRVAGQISRALADFSHAGLRHWLEWDPRHAVVVVERLLPEVVDESTRTLLSTALDALTEHLPAAEAAALPEQAVHLDLTDRNVLGEFEADGAFYPVGVIDFGDMVRTWRASELAVSIHAALGRYLDDPLAAATPVVDGFVAQQPITEVEADHLWTLVLARAAVCVAIESTEAADCPDNTHVRDTADLDTAVLRAALAVPHPLARAVLRERSGLPAWPVDILAEITHSSPAMILDREPLAVVSAWQGITLDCDQADHPAPEAMDLGVAVTVVEGTAVRAPLDGAVAAVGPNWLTLDIPLRTSSVHLHLAGARPTCSVGDIVARGQQVAEVPGHAGPITVQLAAAPGLPRRGRARERAAWTALCPNPAALVGISISHPQDADAALEARGRHVAAAQKLYYRTPPQIVRARGQWMFDDTGRRYLDMVNNVAIIGHSHPRVTAAATQQLALLNTNSRFLYPAIAQYADRIAATLPEELGRIFLVNSGSEAVEVALQLARRFTTRRDVVVHEGAYHGWTTEVFELCTMPGDRPNWRHELAPWVHVADAPDWYRGRHGRSSAPYLASLSAACVRAQSNGGLAAFVHEPILGSRGGIIPPPGYLADAYTAVRSHGGLAIADEVQVGYGRTGKTFWAFESQHVVPDIVVAAKAAGNGHPIGFVACRPEIADAFAEQGSFFSTPGGNPVSCSIGSAVLDVIADEGLRDNAHTIGEHLSAQLAQLASRHPEIGALYGRGLYQGIDLVYGDGSRRPLPAADVDAICERLLELGCIVAPTGLLGNVLKIKPPLCLTRSDADRFIDAIDQVLSERQAYRELTPTPSVRHDWICGA